MYEAIKQQIEEIIQPMIENMQLELVDVNVRPSNRSIVIQVLADRPKGGITVDECARINRHLVNELETQNLVEDYLVEVSSPGLDRPLKTVKDFIRVAGRDVRFYLLEPFQNKREYLGTVDRVNSDAVTIQTKEGAVSIPLSKISKAQQNIS